MRLTQRNTPRVNILIWELEFVFKDRYDMIGASQWFWHLIADERTSKLIMGRT